MTRISLVNDVAKLDVDPEGLIAPEAVIGSIHLPDEIAAGITSELRAGRPTKIQFLIQERGNGAFIVAASLHPTPVKVSTPEPKPKAEPKAEVAAPPQGDKLKAPADPQ